MSSSPKEPNWLLYLSLTTKISDPLVIDPLTILVIILSLYLSTRLLHWAFPGGPAWGKHRWTNKSTRCLSTAIPGPRGFPIIGNMNLMTGLSHRKLARAAVLHRARQLMAFSLGETRVVVTSDPEVAKELLASSSFADRPIKESAYGLLFHRAIGFAPYGEYWRTLRRISSTHLFCPKQIAVSGLQRAIIAEQMVEVLGKAAGAREPVVVRSLLKRASLNNVMAAVFGRKYELGNEKVNCEVAELLSLVDEGYELLGKLNWSDHLPMIAMFDVQRIRARCSQLVPRVNRFVEGIIEEHRMDRTLPDSERAMDFVDVLLSLQRTEKLADSDVVAVLWEMIFRGTDTVAVLIEWVLARLVMHHEVQARVQEELEKVVGSHRPVTESDIGSLVYLQAVIKETLRMHPPGPLLSWARLATTDVQVAGMEIPAGTTAMVNMWAITHDPTVWGLPMEFKPDRFLSKSNSVDFEFSVFGSDLRLAPFGSGRRSCPGKAMAMTTVVFWVATLMHEFEWRLPSNYTHVDLSEILKLSCEMAVPLTIHPSRRQITR